MWDILDFCFAATSYQYVGYKYVLGETVMFLEFALKTLFLSGCKKRPLKYNFTPSWYTCLCSEEAVMERLLSADTSVQP